MLQQTTVAAVKGYFDRFTKRWPTVTALAAADDADVMAFVMPLFQARFRRLNFRGVITRQNLHPLLRQFLADGGTDAAHSARHERDLLFRRHSIFPKTEIDRKKALTP